MKSPNIVAWSVQKNDSVPGLVGVNVCEVVQGPEQVGWPRPGSENVRLCSTPTSLLTKLAVSVVPALTRMTDRSNARFSAVTVTELTAGAAGEVAVGGTGVAAGAEVGAAVVVAVGGVGEAGALVAVALAAVAAGAGEPAGAAVAEVVTEAATVGAAGSTVALVFALSPPPQAANARAAATANPASSFVLFMLHPPRLVLPVCLRLRGPLWIETRIDRSRPRCRCWLCEALPHAE